MKIHHMTTGALPVWLAIPAASPVRFHLHLHGSGERGSDVGNLSKWGLTRLIAEGLELPFAVVVPVCPADSDWKEPQQIAAAEQCLTAIMDEAGHRGRAASISGYSMGVRGVWNSLNRHSGLYDRVLVVASRAPSSPPKPVDPGLSLRIFHGSDDDHEPVAKVRSFCATAAKLGWNLRFEELPAAGHFIAEDVFRRTDIQQWLAGF